MQHTLWIKQIRGVVCGTQKCLCSRRERVAKCGWDETFNDAPPHPLCCSVPSCREDGISHTLVFEYNTEMSCQTDNPDLLLPPLSKSNVQI